MSDTAITLQDQQHALVPGRYWHMLDNGKVQCDLCPRFCKLNEGQRGLCFVRGRLNDEMVLTTWGRSSGFCVDPIEKKPLSHYLPGTPVLSFGTAGCNLTCTFCQNHDITRSRELDKLQSTATPEMIANAAVNSGCRSVAYTYNDPVIFLEYAVDVAQACRERGIKNVAVTAGYICDEPRREFFRYMDAVNVDLKAFSQDFYHRLCTAKLDTVLDTLLYLKQETDIWIEITDLIIPGENDSVTEMETMTQWIVEHLGPDVPVHFSAFHPDWKMQDKARTSPKALMHARQIARKNGIRHAYTGNIHNKPTQSTFCHHCKQLLIGRDWHELSDWNIGMDTEGRGVCASCGTPVAGVFEAEPGDWGRKRMPVRIIEPLPNPV